MPEPQSRPRKIDIILLALILAIGIFLRVTPGAFAPEATLHFLAPLHPQPVVRWMRSHHNTYVFFLPSNDLRFLDSAVLDFTQIFGYAPPGAP